jgi:tetratricopeptide (TPR) repeat protein
MTQFKLKSGFIFLMVCLSNGIFAAIPAFAQSGNPACGELGNTFGPFDYRTERGEKLRMVEGAHFLPYIEALVRGKTSTTPGPDIDYTLRAFPNNHRALMAMMRLGEKEKTPQPLGSRYSVECWFERAILFRPNDTTVRMIFSSYLSKNKRVPEAVAQLEQATAIAENNPFTHYNIGLVYFDMKIYNQALAQAHRAMELGFKRTELRDLLEKAGQWQEPSTPPADTPAATPKAD